jgi:hypothetical protein
MDRNKDQQFIHSQNMSEFITEDPFGKVLGAPIRAKQYLNNLQSIAYGLTQTF